VFSKKFLKDATERAIATFAQTAIASLTVSAGLHDVNWVNVASIAGLATLLSILKSIAATQLGDEDSASLVNLEKK
jgi:hypothetical protein